MASTWEEAEAERQERQRRAQEHQERMQREAQELRATLQHLVDMNGWEDVIEFLAAIAREEYEKDYRPYAERLADTLEDLAGELWR